MESEGRVSGKLGRCEVKEMKEESRTGAGRVSDGGGESDATCISSHNLAIRCGEK